MVKQVRKINACTRGISEPKTLVSCKKKLVRCTFYAKEQPEAYHHLLQHKRRQFLIQRPKCCCNYEGRCMEAGCYLCLSTVENSYRDSSDPVRHLCQQHVQQNRPLVSLNIAHQRSKRRVTLFQLIRNKNVSYGHKPSPKSL